MGRGSLGRGSLGANRGSLVSTVSGSIGKPSSSTLASLAGLLTEGPGAKESPFSNGTRDRKEERERGREREREAERELEKDKDMERDSEKEPVYQRVRVWISLNSILVSYDNNFI